MQQKKSKKPGTNAILLTTIGEEGADQVVTPE